MQDLIVVEQEPIIPSEWDYDISVTKCRNLFREVRQKGATALTELRIAHQLLIEDSKKKIDRRWPNKTFEGYCEDIGIDRVTAERWLHDYFPEYFPRRISTIALIPPPKGTYNVIAIDPPWPYGGDYDPDSHRVASPYPEMSLEQLELLKIPSAPDCILWLWVTNAFMHEAYHLLETWEFEPKTILTWFKKRTGVGHWLRGQTEHCILTIKGSPQITHKAQGTALFSKATSHSTKPDEFYILVESLCGQATEQTHCEMFARKKRKGWAAWGNEV